MRIDNLNKCVLLIDTEFLNKSINENIIFYKNLYPNKVFQKINLYKLLEHFISYISLEDKNPNIDIIFAYTLSNCILENCEPKSVFNFIDYQNVSIETNNSIFFIRSYFADEDETCIEHFINMLDIIAYNSNVSNILMLADNFELNDILEMLTEELDKTFLMIKKPQESEIIIPIRYVNIDYVIASELGLSEFEI